MKQFIIYYILVLFGSCVTPGNVDAHWKEITPYQYIVYYSGNSIDLHEADYGYIWVHNIKKWYYYKNHIIGESAEYYFVFNELTKELRCFALEQEWELFLGKRYLTPKIWTRWYMGEYTWAGTAFLVLLSIPCYLLISEYINKKLREDIFDWSKTSVKGSAICIIYLLILYLLELFPQSF
jgi:hypothetical protein